jgi:hypothetical protein
MKFNFTEVKEEGGKRGGAGDRYCKKTGRKESKRLR